MRALQRFITLFIVVLSAAAAQAAPDIAIYRAWDGVQQARGSTFTFDPVAVNVADSRRWEIRNTGSNTLTLSNPGTLVSGTCFSQIETPASTVAPGGVTYVRVRILCASSGTFTGSVSISSDDPDENPYTFSLSATVTAPPAPEIGLYRASDGVAVPSGGSVTFDSVPAGTATSVRFLIENSGNATLNLNAPAVSGSCFSLIESPTATVASAGSTYMRVRFLCTSPGTFTGQVSIGNNDPNENPYVINLSGTATSASAPDIAVTHNADGSPVPNGGSYNFPALNPGQADSRLFRITNTGTAPLSISSTTVSGTCFSLIEAPATNVAANGGYTTFRVRMLCNTGGMATGQVSIASNDADESPYVISLAGSVWTNGAGYVSQSIPASMVTSTSYTLSVTLTNNGSTTWTAANGYRLGILPHGSGANWGVPDGRVYLGSTESVAPGASKTWSIPVTAPSTPGSYSIQWQMVHEGVEWFGTPSPAVTVNVAAGANNAVYVSNTIPTTMTAGTTYSVSVTMRNTGTSTWTPAGNHRLGILPHGSGATWGVADGRIYLAASESVAPNAQKVWTFNLTAPSAAGSYTMQWSMLQEGVEWFGQATPQVTIQVAQPVNNATYVRQNVPSTMTAGQRYSVWVEMTNNGTREWTAAQGHKLGVPTATSPWGISRVTLGTNERIAAGATKRWVFDVTAPATAGTYDFQWRMVQENVEWFGQASPLTRITVTAPPRVTSVTPDRMNSGSVITMDIGGTGLAAATVQIATAKPTPGTPDRVFPTATLLSNPSSGTSVSVRIDASNPAVEGFYNLVIRNSQGYAWVPFRVLPSRPVIDFWTPTEVAGGGGSFLLVVAGANLRGATVSLANLPGVTVTDIENASDEFLTAVVRTTADLTTRAGQLVVRAPNGQESVVAVTKVAPGGFTAPTRDLAAFSKDSSGQQDAPPLYVQAPDTNAPAASTDIGFSCRLNYSRNRTIAWRLHLFDPETRRHLDNVLRLVPGVKQRFGLEAAVITLTLTLTASAQCHLDGSITDIHVCVNGEILTEVPFWPGFYCNMNLCESGKVRNCTEWPGGGSITTYELTPSACLTGIDLNTDTTQQSWHPSSGKRYSEVDLEYCCTGRRPMILNMAGRTATGQSFSIPDFRIFDVESNTNSCPVQQQVDPELRVYLNNSFDAGAPANDESWLPGSGAGGASLPVSAMPQGVQLVGAFVDKLSNEILEAVPREAPGLGAMTFQVTESTNLRGSAMNYGNRDDAPDFELSGAGTGGTVSALFLGDQTARATLLAYDYAGSATVTGTVGEMTATLKVPFLDEATGLPKRGWLARVNAGQTRRVTAIGSAVEDSDISPFTSSSGGPPTGCVGDGFSNYEEYRGFVVGGQHFRTDPSQKDVFIRRQNVVPSVITPALYDAIGLGHVESLGLNAHELKSDAEYETESVPGKNLRHTLNFNGGFMGGAAVPGSERQSPIVVSFDSISAPSSDPNKVVLGWTHTTNWTPDVPNETVFCHLTVPRIEGTALPAPDGWFKTDTAFRVRMYQYLMSHELGHAMHMCHIERVAEACSDGAQMIDPWNVGALWNLDIMHSGPFQALDDKRETNKTGILPPNTYDNRDLAQLRLHLKATSLCH